MEWGEEGWDSQYLTVLPGRYSRAVQRARRRREEVKRQALVSVLKFVVVSRVSGANKRFFGRRKVVEG